MWSGSHATAENRNNRVLDLDNDLFEGDLKIPAKMIIEHYNITSILEGMEIMGNYVLNVNKSVLHQIRNELTVESDTELRPNDRKAQLKVYVRYARHLRSTDSSSNRPNPYVRITAIDYNNLELKKQTSLIPDTSRPTWNQCIDFGYETWQYMSIQVLDKDSSCADLMSNGERKKLSTGTHTKIRHAAHRGGYLIYSYRLAVNSKNCASNPCQNGGICRDGCLRYTCRCRPGYTGTRCEYRTRNLRVTALYARNLPNTDKWNKSDPYMEFIAVNVNGRLFSMNTTVIQGSLNPTWNQPLRFGRRVWRYLKVRVYDADPGSDDALSDQRTITLSGPVTQSVTLICYRGRAVFEYSLI